LTIAGLGVGVGVGVGAGVGLGVGVGVEPVGPVPDPDVVVAGGFDGGPVSPEPDASAKLAPLPQPEIARQEASARSTSPPQSLAGRRELFKSLPSDNFVFEIRWSQARSPT